MRGIHHPPTVISFGPFEADLQTQELRKQGVRLRLPGQSFQILKMLLERPGELATREELHKALWPSETFVDFEHGVNAAVNRLREVLGDSADSPLLIETLPRRGYRFIGTIRPPAATDAAAKENIGGGVQKGIVWKVIVPAAIAVAALAAGGYFYLHPKPKLTDKDTIVLSDFDNKTGDNVFDDALKQGLSVQLEQSPFLDLLSDQKVGETLKLMGRAASDRLTPEVTREVCQRTGARAVLDGSIAQIGTQYLLTLKAVNCTSGALLASTEAQASDKNRVLDALGKTASEIRGKLGESMNTTQKFDTPLEQATTPSLEALKAYTLGWKALVGTNDFGAATRLFRRATQLDPKFALAYAALGQSYNRLGERDLAAESTRKAYELRDRVSEPERLYIDSHYHWAVTGNQEKARQIYEIWVQTYPRDFRPRVNLGAIYNLLGQHDYGVADALEALRLNPGSGLIFGEIANRYLCLNHLEDSRATVQDAMARNGDSSELRIVLYKLAFLQRDANGMDEQVAWSAGKPGVEDVFLSLEADTNFYSGRVEKAREFSSRAVESAKRAELTETAALRESFEALREALFNNAEKARSTAKAALRLSVGQVVQCVAALALALAGETAQAQKLVDELTHRFPEDTFVQFEWVPTIRAQIALEKHDFSGSIESLKRAAVYEMGAGMRFYPAYIRGQAYLTAHQGKESAAEFQKVLDHWGVVVNEPIGALAHLQLGRAYAMQGDTANAKVAYQDFLTLWKDADLDIPILKQAKAEYAKLQ